MASLKSEFHLLASLPPSQKIRRKSSRKGKYTYSLCEELYHREVTTQRIVKTFYHLGAFVILLGVLLLVYTIAGMQFFANRFRFNDAGAPITDIGSQEWINAPEISRYNFDDFSLSFATVFQCLTTENWNDIMFDSWRVYGPFGVLFPVSIVLIGTFVLMNLFLGILLGNFQVMMNLKQLKKKQI